MNEHSALIEPSELRVLTNIDLQKNSIGTEMMPRNFDQIVAFAKLMSRSGPMIPTHFRDKPGACMAIAMLAFRWGMDPWAIANKTYFVNEKIAYESQLIAAILINCAPIKGRPEYDFNGDDDQLTCTCSVTDNDGKILSVTSPKIIKITPKKSPLWVSDPPQQLSYYTLRTLGRRYFPDVILGVYDREEVSSINDQSVAPKTNKNNAERLSATLAAASDGRKNFDVVNIKTSMDAAADQKPVAMSNNDPHFGYGENLKKFAHEIAQYTSADDLNRFVKTYGNRPGEEWYSNAPRQVQIEAQQIFENLWKKLDEAEKLAEAEKAEPPIEAAPIDAPTIDWSERLMELEESLWKCTTEAEISVAEVDVNKIATPEMKDTIGAIIFRHRKRISGSDEAGPVKAPEEDNPILVAARKATQHGKRKFAFWLSKLNQQQFDLIEPHLSELKEAAAKAKATT